MKSKYPLEALQTVRKLELERRALELSEQVKHVTRVRGEHQLVAEQKKKLAARLSNTLDGERRELEQGSLTAADLLRGETWRDAEQERLRALELSEQTSKARLGRAEAAEAEARKALAAADATLRALDKHRVDWEAERNTKAELQVEEASLDVWTATKYGPRRG